LTIAQSVGGCAARANTSAGGGLKKFSVGCCGGVSTPSSNWAGSILEHVKPAEDEHCAAAVLGTAITQAAIAGPTIRSATLHRVIALPALILEGMT